MKNILILCTGNSCRSQIAQGYLENLLKNKAVVYSAGIETHGVNPRAISTMNDDGVDITHHTSNNMKEYLSIPFDYIITVCDHANENCPYFPGNAKRFHYDFPDPAKASGTEEEIMKVFASVRNEIKRYCLDLVKDNF